MTDDLLLVTTDLMNKLAISEILHCNDITSRYGLILNITEAQELVETRTEALVSNGRIEFAGGTINKLITRFCDSPYLSQGNYATSLNDLIETFYYFKNETLDEISDDELISIMKKYFDQNCKGSVELLQNRELEALAHNIRYGIIDYTDLFEDAEDKVYLFEEENYYE